MWCNEVQTEYKFTLNLNFVHHAVFGNLVYLFLLINDVITKAEHVRYRLIIKPT